MVERSIRYNQQNDVEAKIKELSPTVKKYVIMDRALSSEGINTRSKQVLRDQMTGMLAQFVPEEHEELAKFGQFQQTKILEGSRWQKALFKAFEKFD